MNDKIIERIKAAVLAQYEHAKEQGDLEERMTWALCHAYIFRAQELLQPFAEFAQKWNAHPIKGLADELYTIHSGEISASFRLSDCQNVLNFLQEQESGVK